MKKAITISAIILIIIVSISAIFAQDSDPTILYKAYLSGSGWSSNFSQNGETAGDPGSSDPIGAIEIKTEKLPVTTSLEARAFINGQGWQNNIQNNGILGKLGRDNTIQALEINLKSPLGSVSLYNVYYRVYVSGIGWLDWAKNGETAGTTGFNIPIDAVEIQILPSYSEAPGPTDTHSITDTESLNMQIDLSLTKTDGSNLSGKSGETLEISDTDDGFNSISASLTNSVIPDSSFSYQIYTDEGGWTEWVDSGSNIETSGEPIEAIQFKVNGGLENFYDVYYQVKIKDYGWLDWAKNGEPAGSMNGNKPIQALNITLLPKNQPEPGIRYRSLIEFPAGEYFDGRGIVVSIPDQLVFVQDENNQIVFVADCNSGMADTESETPRGEYEVIKKSRDTTLTGEDYVYDVSYWIPFIGQEYGFHDSTWRPDDAYGRNVYTYDGSHGCVNMRLDDMKEFYNLVQTGDPIIIV